MTKPLAIVAVGGNALIRDDQHDSIPDQYEAVVESARHIAEMIDAGWDLVLTHGNGPQVGFILRRSELAADEVRPVPLDYAVGDTQGAIGYMFQKALSNALRLRGIDRRVVTVVTQTRVSPDDPAFLHPAKPIGAFFDEATARKRQQALGWTLMEDAGRGWRRTVASPEPLEIIEHEVIATLLAQGCIVIACGGGGIPVVVDERRQISSERLNTAPGYRIAMILLGIAVTPVLLSSSSLGSQLSSSALIKVVVMGSLILTILSVITICVGEKARLPTYGIVKYSFGEKGAVAINILLAISLFGWIAVTANMFGHSVHDLLAQHGLNVPVPILVATGCVIFVIATAFGFELLGKVAQFAVPVIALMLAYCLYVAANGTAHVPAQLADMNTGVAVSTVVGTIIVLVATLPDFGSFVHDRKHAVIGAGLAFLVAYPLLYWAGATPSGMTGQHSLLGSMAVFGAVLPAALLLIFATVTGNAGNMFQGTLVVSTLFTRFPKWQITVALGVLAVIVGSMDIMAWFIPFLLFLGIATPPVAGIYIADFLLYRRGGYDAKVLAAESQVKALTFVAWIIGSLVGFMTVKGMFTLTGIPSVDSIVVACVCYTIFSRFSLLRSAVSRS